MKKYDYIIAGGGAAGLSLAYHLLRSPLRDRRILIIDREVKQKNDRTWCFWSDRFTHFTPIYHRSWQKLAFRSQSYSADILLGDYRYNMLRGIDFYNFTHTELEAWPNIDFLIAPVDQVMETPHSILVAAGDQTFAADWLFDSRFSLNQYEQYPNRYHYLLQHFLGWEIHTEYDAFDPSLPFFFDFRTPQKGAMRFFYLLPMDARTALVEYTLFSGQALPEGEYEDALRDYIQRVLGIQNYTLSAVESGKIPMSDQPFARKTGARTLNIGTRGGRVKPSTGYAFLRIQHDSTAVVRSLERYNHPFAIPRAPDRYRWLDSILLQILYRNGAEAERIFADLFRKNPIQRLFNFLDESGGILNNLQVIGSVPPGPFLRAWYRLKVKGQI